MGTLWMRKGGPISIGTISPAVAAPVTVANRLLRRSATCMRKMIHGLGRFPTCMHIES